MQISQSALSLSQYNHYFLITQPVYPNNVIICFIVKEKGYLNQIVVSQSWFV